jgi:myo-inositol-1(or 4)-monophosphatase
MVETLENIKKFMQQGIVGIRRLGSAALDLSYVAAGRASGFWEFELSPWDFAAAKLILEEAGGLFTDLDGDLPALMNKTYAIASNPDLHQKMMEILSSQKQK